MSTIMGNCILFCVEVINQVYRCGCQIANLILWFRLQKKNFENYDITSSVTFLVIGFKVKKKIISMGKYIFNYIERNCFMKHVDVSANCFFKECVVYMFRKMSKIYYINLDSFIVQSSYEIKQ